jgi:hypothetical protein
VFSDEKRGIDNKNIIFSSLLKDIKSTVRLFSTLNTFSLKKNEQFKHYDVKIVGYIVVVFDTKSFAKYFKTAI